MAFKSSRRLIPSVRDRMDSIFGTRQYYQKVLSYGPIAYWPLWEAAGLTAECLVNSPAQDGTYTGVTLGQAGIGDGNTAPLFDGANDFVDIYTTAFRDAFNGDEGTVAAWGKVANVGTWTDGAQRHLLTLYPSANDNVYLYKDSGNNTFTWIYTAGGVSETVQQGGLTSVGWNHFALTWSAAADQVKAYLNGAQSGATQVGLGVWAGTLIAALTNIGCFNNAGPNLVWNGTIAHVPIFDQVLTQPQIADLATV